MNDKKQASINLDEIRQRKLGDMSAADFLGALSRGNILPISHLVHWPEKKKVELWVEPEHNHTVGNIIDFVNEKKKMEYEKPIPVEYGKPIPSENNFDLGSLIRNPDFIRQVAELVVQRIRM